MTTPDPASPESRLLAAVAAVAAELHPGRPAPAVTLDILLDRELGFDSLGRVELLARIENEFGAALPETAFATVETPRDLLRALATALPASGAAAPAPLAVAPAGEAAVPRAAMTLTEVLDWHATQSPDRLWVRFFADEGEGETLTYGQLKAAAEGMAAGLQALDLEPGGRVALMLPTGPEYFQAFFGTLLAGGVPVPLYPPARASQIGEHLERQIGILKNCRAAILVTTSEVLPLAGLLTGRVESLRKAATAAEIAIGRPPLRPQVKPGDIAFLQYTSGSTGQPKGVVLTHANLLANVRAMGEALRAGPGDVFVSWLPLYHDMGLIGAALGTLYFAVPLVLMSPLAFLARPQRWLAALSRYRGTLSAAPNFAYELAARKTDPGGLDLSAWRAALNGAEAVGPATLEAFAAHFAPAGFRREALMPVYGLAECSVGLAFPPLGRGPVVETLDREAFTRLGRAVPDPRGTLKAVRCGRPLPGHQIRIADKRGHELPDRREGRVQFQGPSATSGYFRNPEATRRLFDGQWLDSGDLGYMADGEVHVTGRVKDLIIRAGRNIQPAEIEEAVGALEGVRRGNVAVFAAGDERAGTERLVVLAESRTRGAAREALQARVADLATSLAGTPPDEVVLAPPGSVLKTSSGKVRRDATRRLYESGKLGASRPAVWMQVARLAAGSLGPRLRRLLRDGGEKLFALHALLLAGLALPFLWAAAMLGMRGLVRALVRTVLALAGLRPRVEGLENLPAGGAVLAANHASYLDGFLLTAALPRFPAFAAKAELAASDLLKTPLERLGILFVERRDHAKAAGDARLLGEAARAGAWVAVFPEGTFTRMPGLLPFRMGAFQVAAETGVPVVPVTIRGSRAVLRGDSLFPRRGRVTITIGQPLHPPRDDGWAAAVALRDQARAEILAHCGEPDLGAETTDYGTLIGQG